MASTRVGVSARFDDLRDTAHALHCAKVTLRGRADPASGVSVFDGSILATAVDGFHRSHRYQVIGDAVACRQPGTGDAAAYKQAIVNVLGNFATVHSSAELIRTRCAIAV